jgi:hypothetical protein
MYEHNTNKAECIIAASKARNSKSNWKKLHRIASANIAQFRSAATEAITEKREGCSSASPHL